MEKKPGSVIVRTQPEFDSREHGYEPNRQAKDFNDTGLQYQALGKLDKAIEAFKKAFSRDPYFSEARQNLAQAHVGKGAVLARRGDEKAALKHYQRASNLDPLNESIYSGMANVYYARGHRLEVQGYLEEALEAYKICLKIVPEHQRALKQAGIVEIERDNIETALQYLEKCRKVAPDASDIYELLGKAEFSMGNLERADMHWKRAILLDPDNADLKERLDTSGNLRGRMYLKRAVTLAELSEWDRANILFEKVLSLNLDLQPEELLLLAESKFKTGSPAEAADILGKVLDARPGMVDAHLLLGDIYAASDQEEMAFECYLEARQRSSESLEADFKLAQLSAGRGRYPEAIRFLEEVLARNPRNRRALENIGIVYARCKQFDLALMYWDRVKELDPGYANVYYDIALVMTRKQRYDEAIVNLRKAIELDPDNVLYHYSLSLAYRQKGMTSEARREWKNVLRLGPDTRYARVARRMLVEEGSGATAGFSDARSLYNYAYICQKSGRLGEALSTYIEVLDLDPNHVMALIACGEIYLSRRLNREAGICFYRALNTDPENIQGLNGVGKAFLSLGFVKRAVTYLEKNYMGGKLDQGSKVALAKAYELSNRLDLATGLYNELMESDLYGEWGTLAGQRIRQIADGKPLSGLSPLQVADNHLALAFKFVEHGFNQEAEAEFKASALLSPENPSIYLNMGNFYLTLERIEEATDSFKKVLLLEPDDLAATERLAEIYWDIGEREEAGKYLELAVRLNPRNSSLLFNLVEFYESLDKPREAMIILQRFVTMNQSSPSLVRAGEKITALEERIAEMKLSEEPSDLSRLEDFVEDDQRMTGETTNLEPVEMTGEAGSVHSRKMTGEVLPGIDETR
ncbi:MAG: tetratricopeptide repeat protein [bacterium]|nr:tetratricopeptide repeat protein [bacterium]